MSTFHDLFLGFKESVDLESEPHGCWVGVKYLGLHRSLV